jgi:PBP1b-binding outer membrane lipoprotein LpoB
MKIIILLTITVLILGGCGKKSDPKYQGWNKTKIVTYS